MSPQLHPHPPKGCSLGLWEWEGREEPICPCSVLPVPPAKGHWGHCHGQEQQEVALPAGTLGAGGTESPGTAPAALGTSTEGQEGQTAPAGGRAMQRGGQRALQEGPAGRAWIGWVELWEISPSEVSHSLPEGKGLWIPLHRLGTLGSVGSARTVPSLLVSAPSAVPAPRDSRMSPQEMSHSKAITLCLIYTSHKSRHHKLG